MLSNNKYCAVKYNLTYITLVWKKGQKWKIITSLLEFESWTDKEILEIWKMFESMLVWTHIYGHNSYKQANLNNLKRKPENNWTQIMWSWHFDDPKFCLIYLNFKG